MDEKYLDQLAALPGASQLLHNYGGGVMRGDYSWRQIVEGSWQKPPEILQLLEQGLPFRLTESAAPPSAAPTSVQEWRPAPVPPQNPAPRHRDPGMVGPSDWPDDFDDYPDNNKSWLV